MPSFVGSALVKVASVLAYSYRKNNSPEQTLSSIRQKLLKNMVQVNLPADLQATVEHQELLAGQNWPVFQLNSSSAQPAVVIFWHGGGFINTVSPVIARVASGY